MRGNPSIYDSSVRLRNNGFLLVYSQSSLENDFNMISAWQFSNADELNTIREQLLEKLISAQEAERRRIARELHDEASQSLAAFVINLEAIADTVPSQYPAIREKLDALQSRATQTLSGIRNLALELRPSALDDLGLSAAVDWYARDFMKKRGLTAEVSVDYPPQQLSIHSETSLFRIIQEALNNVVQHAEASHVEVLLNGDMDSVRLQVKDNGRGFEAARVMKNLNGRQSLGLHGMAERASLLGGTLEIESKPGQGTQITVEIPLEKERLTDG
jgi:two-component system sensor histidine kinase UhpB